MLCNGISAAKSRCNGVEQSPARAKSADSDRNEEAASRQKRAAEAAPLLRRFIRDERGAVVVLAAIMFPVLIGGMGLGVETSLWYMTQRKLQHAADVSAHAAGVRNRAGDSYVEMKAAATHIASASGWIPPGNAGNIVALNVPPTSGAYAGDPDAAEVIVIETWPRWFTAFFADGEVPLSGRAVAQIQAVPGSACILALSSTESGAVTVSGSTSVTLEGCNVAANSLSESAVAVGGSGTLSTECVSAVGGITTSDGLTVSDPSCPKPNSAVIRDPYADVAEPEVTGDCASKNVGKPNQTTVVTPTVMHPSGVPFIRYCNGLDVKGNVTFEPGLYIIEGPFSVNGGGATTDPAVISGAGVTFFLAGCSNLKLNGNVTLNLSAPTSGPYSGLLFFGDDSCPGVNHVINGAAGSTLQGAIYLPAGDLSYSGDSAGTGGCTQIVASTVTLIGNSTLEASCEAAGTSPIVSEIVVIVE